MLIIIHWLYEGDHYSRNMIKYSILKPFGFNLIGLQPDCYGPVEVKKLNQAVMYYVTLLTAIFFHFYCWSNGEHF